MGLPVSGRGEVKNSESDETSALIASSCQKTSGFTQDDLSESGKWIYDMLHKKGGAAGRSPEGSVEDGRGIYRKCSRCIKLTAGVIDQKKKVL